MWDKLLKLFKSCDPQSDLRRASPAPRAAPFPSQHHGRNLRSGGAHPGHGPTTTSELRGPGTYKFGYDTGPGPNQSFRQGREGPEGEVKGRYGYVEPSGALRVVEYKADASGFHILKTRTLVPDMKPKPAVKVQTPFVGPLPLSSPPATWSTWRDDTFQKNE
ncbi:uncharacterized protein CEXT_598341 [Caerostris extrusa]|uniref:Uncharacterized protein n=1 Tax=Caerostris extrusa TaxID=172846 RepID=A0AAV4NAZ4_CAEEX|nr:uncharacterized protein CEXT_598341 [Caerostris extrusa]